MEFSFDIDEMQLHREWKDQPKRYFKIGELLANAKRNYDEIDASLKLAKAEVDMDVRANPDAYGLAKITEAVVESAVLRSKKVQGIIEELREARHECDILTVALEAMQHRKRSLENLVSLHIANYYSAPVANAEAGQELQEMGRQTTRRRVGVKKRE